jgi:hypothetical protein
LLQVFSKFRNYDRNPRDYSQRKNREQQPYDDLGDQLYASLIA